MRLSGVSYTVAQVAAFVRSPLLKRLRHFAVRGGPPRSVDFDIADAVDPDRIETFAIGKEELQTGVAAKLQTSSATGCGFSCEGLTPRCGAAP